MIAAFAMMVALHFSSLQVDFAFESWGIIGIGAIIQLVLSFWRGA